MCDRRLVGMEDDSPSLEPSPSDLETEAGLDLAQIDGMIAEEDAEPPKPPRVLNRLPIFRKAQVGRPPLYEPVFCQRVVVCGYQGYSLTQIGRDLGVARQTLVGWAERYPEFASALALARDLALAWWEDQGMAGIWAGKYFNDRVLKFAMINRFPADYKDRVEVSGALARIDFTALGDDQIARIAAGEHPYVVLGGSRQLLAPGDEEPREATVSGEESEPSVRQELGGPGARAPRAAPEVGDQEDLEDDPSERAARVVWTDDGPQLEELAEED